MSDLKVIKVLEKAGADLNHITKHGATVLSLPFFLDRFYPKTDDLPRIEPVMDYLLTKTNISENMSFFSILYIIFKHTSFLDPNKRDISGATPLHYAAWWGTVSIGNLIISSKFSYKCFRSKLWIN